MNAKVWTSRHRNRDCATYLLTDRLHRHHPVQVSADGITSAVTNWLAHPDVRSSLADDFARAIREGDWANAHFCTAQRNGARHRSRVPPASPGPTAKVPPTSAAR